MAAAGLGGSRLEGLESGGVGYIVRVGDRGVEGRGINGDRYGILTRMGYITTKYHRDRYEWPLRQ